MASTPEAKVKRKLSKLLGFHNVNYFMPVQSGYGMPALDYICCHKGRYFQIETKAASGVMTPRQTQIARMVEQAGGKAFLINEDETTWTILVEWLLSE
jgi:hypothetical protein